MFSVYRLTFPTGKTYIGYTGQKPQQRWRSGWGYQEHTEMFADIIEYGWRNITKEVVATEEDKKRAQLLEQYYIFIENEQNECGTYNKCNELHAKKMIYCEESEQIYSSVRDAAYEIGVSRQALSRVLNGRGELCGGCHWRYMDAVEWVEKFILGKEDC